MINSEYDKGTARFKHLFLERLEAIDSLSRSLEASNSDAGYDQFVAMIGTCDVQQRRYINEKLEMLVDRLTGWRAQFGETLECD